MTLVMGAGPLMTSIAFVLLFIRDEFDMSTAFTTMFLLSYLSMAILMLPMIMSMLSESMISSSRIQAFLLLPERDPGFIVNIDKLTEDEIKQLPDEVQEKMDEISILFTGSPSFTWCLASDK